MAAVDLAGWFEFTSHKDVGPGWRAINEPSSPDAVARVAVGPSAGVLRGTVDSSLGCIRRTPLEHIALSRGLNNLEAAAVALAFETRRPLPLQIETKWAEAYWDTEADKIMHRIVADARRRDSLQVVTTALEGLITIRGLAWLSENRPARFEAFLLSLAVRCERRHLSALRRAVVAEWKRYRAELRLRGSRQSLFVEGILPSSDDLIDRVLKELSAVVDVHRDRLWTGRQDRPRGGLGSERWIGRFDPRGGVVALEIEFVRAHVARFADPDHVIRLMTERGLIRTKPSGSTRWQHRVGGQGRRIWALGFPSVALKLTDKPS